MNPFVKNKSPNHQQLNKKMPLKNSNQIRAEIINFNSKDSTNKVSENIQAEAKTSNKKQKSQIKSIFVSKNNGYFTFGAQSLNNSPGLKYQKSQ